MTPGLSNASGRAETGAVGVFVVSRMTRKATIRPATEAVAPLAAKITIQEMRFPPFHLRGDGDTSCIRRVFGGCDLVVYSAEEMTFKKFQMSNKSARGGDVA